MQASPKRIKQLRIQSVGRLTDQREEEGSSEACLSPFCKFTSREIDPFLSGGVREGRKEHRGQKRYSNGNSFTWKQGWRLNIILNDT